MLHALQAVVEVSLLMYGGFSNYFCLYIGFHGTHTFLRHAPTHTHAHSHSHKDHTVHVNVHIKNVYNKYNESNLELEINAE